jgi:RluA family pseudouridine synthase
VAELGSGLDRARAEALVAAGHCFVDGRRARDPDAAVAAGARLVVHDGPLEPAPEPRLLHVDARVVAVDKAPGDHLNETETSPRLSLLERLVERWPELRLVHRLDRDTSGVVLFARGPEVAEALSAAFRTRRVHKRYLALIDGEAEPETIDAPIAKDPRRPRARRVHQGGKASRTRVTPLGCVGNVGAIRAEPETGRTHQIRVHLAHVGTPLLGDALYGGPVVVRWAGVAHPVPRVMLHAARIVVDLDGRSLDLSAPLPDELRRFDVPGLALSRAFD